MSFSSDLPEEVSTLLSKLNVVKRIPADHKLNVRNSTYSNIWSYVDIGLRKVRGESGSRTVNYVNGLIDTSITLSRQYPNYSSTISAAIYSLSTALANLYQAYGGEPTVQGDIGVIQLRIQQKAFETAITEHPTSRGSTPIPYPRKPTHSDHSESYSRSKSPMSSDRDYGSFDPRPEEDGNLTEEDQDQEMIDDT